MLIKPVGDRILIQPYIAADKTESGLLMENNSNTTAASVRGTVIAVGQTTQFKIGDEILYRRYSVDELKTVTEKGEVVVSLVDCQDVLALIEK